MTTIARYDHDAPRRNLRVRLLALIVGAPLITLCSVPSISEGPCDLHQKRAPGPKGTDTGA